MHAGWVGGWESSTQGERVGGSLSRMVSGMLGDLEAGWGGCVGGGGVGGGENGGWSGGAWGGGVVVGEAKAVIGTNSEMSRL